MSRTDVAIMRSSLVWTSSTRNQVMNQPVSDAMIARDVRTKPLSEPMIPRSEMIKPSSDDKLLVLELVCSEGAPPSTPIGAQPTPIDGPASARAPPLPDTDTVPDTDTDTVPDPDTGLPRTPRQLSRTPADPRFPPHLAGLAPACLRSYAEEAAFMEANDVTLEVLRGIRDDVRGVRGETNALRGETNALRGEMKALRGEMNTRFDETNGRLATLERRQVESEVRLATELVTLVGVVREVRDAIRDDRVSRVRVDDHERRILALEERTTRGH